MFGIINFSAFAIAAFFLILSPGTDSFYILGRSIADGKKAGILSALGIGTGSLIHTLFAALGLSVILAKSALAFNIIKYAGAAYLIYLGIQVLLVKNNTVTDTDNLQKQKNNPYLAGILTNILNPKIAVFYLAFLPQFIDPNYSNQVVSFLFLGGIFTFFGTIWCLLLAIYSAKFSEKITNNSTFKSRMDKIAGLVFIGLGLKVALEKT